MLLLALLTTCLSGCVTLAPEAQALRTTREPNDVRGCTILGTVEPRPPFASHGDAIRRLQNDAAGKGADTLLVTSSVMSVTGVAYRCHAG